MKPVKGWAVINESGEYQHETFSDSSNHAIEKAQKLYSSLSWACLNEIGYRCIRVTLRED